MAEKTWNRWKKAAFSLLLIACIFSASFCLADDAVPWGIRAMGMDLLKEEAESGSELLSGPFLIAVLDTGCDVNHSVFKGRISPDSRGFMGDGKDDIIDEGGHGTQVTSVIAQATPDHVQLLILKVGGPDGYAPDEQINDAILYALEKGAGVINMCINVKYVQAPFASRTPKKFSEGIRKSYEAGVPFVVSAGNDNMNTWYYYPASDPNVITVSAINDHGILCSFSNLGENVQFCAPGLGIPAAVSGTADGFEPADGTSVAAPHIAAAAAYIKMLHPEATVRQVCGALQSCAFDLGFEGRDELFGEGMPQIDGYILHRPYKTVFPDQPVLHASEGLNGETAENLFCGDDSKKWCVKAEDTVFVEWKEKAPICPSAMVLVTANDNSSHPGRNPKNARLFCRADQKEPWVQIWEQPDYFTIPDEDYKAWSFEIDAAGEYRYFRLEIYETTGSEFLQLARIELTGKADPLSDQGNE